VLPLSKLGRAYHESPDFYGCTKTAYFWRVVYTPRYWQGPGCKRKASFWTTSDTPEDLNRSCFLM